MLHLVGWRQGYDPQHPIDGSLTRSDSGLYFQSAHPLLTLEAVRSVMPDDWGWDYPEWNMAMPYRTGDVVSHKGKLWMALRYNHNREPDKGAFSDDFNEDYGNPCWREYDFFSAYLRNLVQDGIANMVHTFLTQKSLMQESRPLLERLALFDGAGRINDIVAGQDDMCGFEIVPVRGMGVTASIRRIGLQMRGATGKVKVYLFHSSSPDPVRTAELEITDTRGMFRWFDVDGWDMPYIGENNAGGAWYLCYSQAELPAGMVAVNLARDWSREPCGTCNPGNLQLWRELTKYLQVMPFKTADSGGRMWDIEDNIYTPSTSYGINFEISVGCDLTDFIISQRGMFANVLQKQVAYDVLRTLAMNPYTRVNRIQSNADKADILYELDGDPQGKASGLGYELRKAYEALRLDTESIDRICLTCNRRGVRYGVV